MDIGLYVSPLYRQKGIASQIIELSLILGATRLSVSKDNQKAFTLYKKLGIKIKTNCIFYSHFRKGIK